MYGERIAIQGIRENTFSLLALTILRALFFVVAVLFVDLTHDLGTSPFWLSFFVVLGCIAGTFLPFFAQSIKELFLYLTAPYILFQAILFLDTAFFIHERVLLPHALLLHGNLCYALLSFALVTTWLFWRHSIVTTIEILVLSLGVVTLLSGHRNYNLIDIPLLIGSLAWELGTDIQSLLIIFSIVTLAILWAYLTLATSPARPIFHTKSGKVHYYQGPTKIFRIVTPSLAALLILVGISRYVLNTYNNALAERGSNGVGMTKEDDNEAIGNSPLGFHSALGSNNQPAAIVRLEGDYLENPFSPMLYLREGALSSFDGHEMVIAGKVFDRDVPFSNVDQEYVEEEDPELLWRVPVVQSVYLLAEHKKAFGIDYPLSISPLKNPAQDRFKGAYKVYSIAPAFSREDLRLLEHGDPRWTEEEQQHFLEKHHDKRYEELAFQITEGIESSASKASAITQYLSKNAIYTLSPNHEIEENEDPVAPFLFGDLRGYCVHFAHATVYMLRALNIPARVATGYLTDLSQSKDGHILLRMSDRHAWAEMYIRGRGWIPYDTQPEQVESHADSQVDMQLLEELMGLIGPDQDLFADDLIADEKGFEKPHPNYLPELQTLFLICLLSAFGLLAVKLYIRYGWKFLPASKKTKLARGYRTVASILHDLGYQRFPGETRVEFQKRMLKRFPQSFLEKLTLWINPEQDHAQHPDRTLKEIHYTIEETLSLLSSQIHFKEKIITTCNPSSTLAFILGERW